MYGKFLYNRQNKEMDGMRDTKGAKMMPQLSRHEDKFHSKWQSHAEAIMKFVCSDGLDTTGYHRYTHKF